MIKNFFHCLPLLALLFANELLISCSEKEDLSPSIRPNEDNTGVQKGITLESWTGSDYNTQSDVIYDGIEFPSVSSGYYTFSGSNLVFRNCKINSGILFSGDNIKIEYCEIIGGLSLSGTAAAVISFNNIHNSQDDGIHITSDNGRVSNVTVNNNFIHSFMPACGAHADGMQVRGVDRLFISNNAIDMGQWRQVCNLDALNSAIFLQDANGGNENVTIDRNYLNGGGYVLYIGKGPNTEITNNRIGRDEKFGVINNTSNAGDIIKNSGNVRDDTNEPLDLG